MSDAAPGGSAVRIAVVVLPHGEGLPLPAWRTAGAAGADVCAARDLSLGPGARARVPTGLRLAIPLGWELQVRPRSGLAATHGITVVNAPGTIDADFRGELEIALVNLGEARFEVRRGDRIAQLVLAPVHRGTFERVVELPPSERGAGGFGSTGR